MGTLNFKKSLLKWIFYEKPMGQRGLTLDMQTIHSAKIYRSLRKKGVIIRNTVDCIIAAVAIESKIPLLHNDKDFIPIEKHCGLKVFNKKIV